jgi:hypothetical protein
MVTATATATATAKTHKAKQLKMWVGSNTFKSCKYSIILIFTLLLGWQSIVIAAANITREKRPDIALKIAPNDAGALAIRNDFNLTRDEKSKNWHLNAQDSISSYKSNGLNSRAVRQLGFLASNRGENAKAAALIASSEGMSRRDLGAQLWLVNAFAEKNDVKNALRHIDIGLRAIPESRALLFPILSNALSDPSFQRSFAPYILASPTWIASFIDYALTKNVNIEILSQSIVLAGGLPNGYDNQKLNMLMLDHLIDKGHYVEAKNYFVNTKGMKLSLLDRAELNSNSIDPRYGPLAWKAFQTVDAEGAIELGPKAGSYQLNVTTGSGQRRVVAQKLLYLSPGNYHLSAKYAFLSGGKESAVHWEFQCPKGLGFTSISKAVVTAKVEPVSLNIPSDCAAQYLKLIVVGGRDDGDTNIIISDLQIETG